MSLTVWLVAAALGLVQIFQCAGKREDSLSFTPDTQHVIKSNEPAAVKPDAKVTSKSFRPAAPPKPNRAQPPTYKAAQEFPLNEIFFKGRETNEANNFFRKNDKLGKPLEQVYEQAREQDLNEIEHALKRRLGYLY